MSARRGNWWTRTSPLCAPASKHSIACSVRPARARPSPSSASAFRVYSRDPSPERLRAPFATSSTTIALCGEPARKDWRSGARRTSPDWASTGCSFPRIPAITIECAKRPWRSVSLPTGSTHRPRFLKLRGSPEELPRQNHFSGHALECIDHSRPAVEDRSPDQKRVDEHGERGNDTQLAELSHAV